MGLFDRFSDRIEGFLDEVFIPEKLRSQLERASRLMERGNYDQALDLLQEAESDHPEHQRTYHLLGVCRFFREEYEPALEALERAVELREEPASHFYAGRAAEELGAHRDAKLHFQKALSASESPPFEFELYFGLGRVLLALDRPEKAVHELEKADELSPGEPEVAAALAKALLAQDRTDAARDVLEELDEEELGADGLVLRARVVSAGGEPGRAAAIFESALDRNPHLAEAQLGAARGHLAAGAPARAQEYLLRVLDGSEDPADLLDARVLLGRCNEKVDELERAGEHYEAALDLADEAADADDVDDLVEAARLGAARVAVARGDIDRATSTFEELLGARDPRTRREARLGLARCRLQRDQASEARRLLEEIDVDEAPDDFRVERLHLAGRAALATGDAAESLVALQEALALADRPADEQALQEVRSEALRQLQPTWDLPDALDGPVAVEDVLDQLRSFVTSAHELEPFVPDVQQLSEAMSRPLSVAIVGEFNAGKSTLVNALVGEEVVPTGVLPTTAHTCYIRYGPRKTARVHYCGPEDWPDDAEDEVDPGPGDVIEVDFAEARDRMEEHTDRIDHLEFLYPHPQLRSIHFWDTPGFNAADGEHDEVASAALDEAEAILWVFDAKQTLSRTEFDRLSEIPESRDRVVVLLNKRDELDDDEIEELETHVDETVGAAIAGQFAISARDAFARATDEDAGDDAPQFAEFREMLERHFVQRAGHIKTLEVRRRLEDLVERIDDFVDELLSRYDGLEERAGDLRSWVRQQASTQPEERTEHEARTVDDQFDFARTAVAREIREDLRPRGTFFSRMVLDEEDREFALRVFEERLTDILARSRTRVERDVAAFEGELDARLGPMLDQLSVPNARSLDRRLEGLHDEIRALELLLGERVYGHLRAKIHGRIDAAGADLLEGIEPENPEDLEPWRAPLETLLPDAADHIDAHLSDWYREFFLAADRFSDRVHRDFELLRLEAEHRFDTAPLRELLQKP